MTNIAFDFLSVNSNAATVLFTMTNDTLARTAVVTGGSGFDVGVAAQPFTNADVTAASASGVGALSSFPFMASAIVMIYNLPGLPNVRISPSSLPVLSFALSCS